MKLAFIFVLILIPLKNVYAEEPWWVDAPRFAETPWWADAPETLAYMDQQRTILGLSSLISRNCPNFSLPPNFEEALRLIENNRINDITDLYVPAAHVIFRPGNRVLARGAGSVLLDVEEGRITCQINSNQDASVPAPSDDLHGFQEMLINTNFLHRGLARLSTKFCYNSEIPNSFKRLQSSVWLEGSSWLDQRIDRRFDIMAANVDFIESFNMNANNQCQTLPDSSELLPAVIINTEPVTVDEFDRMFNRSAVIASLPREMRREARLRALHIQNVFRNSLVARKYLAYLKINRILIAPMQLGQMLGSALSQQDLRFRDIAPSVRFTLSPTYEVIENSSSPRGQDLIVTGYEGEGQIELSITTEEDQIIRGLISREVAN